MDLVLVAQLHVVAQVVESKFVVRAVGDIAFVCIAASCIVHVGDYDSNGEAKEVVDWTHPLCVALCKVVVDCDNVHAFAFKGIEIGGRHACERLSFSCLHFKDLALVQDYGSHYLDVVVALAKNPE